MKTYEPTADNFQDILKEVKGQIKATLKGKKITTAKQGEGEIVNFYSINITGVTKPNAIVVAKFDSGEASYMVNLTSKTDKGPKLEKAALVELENYRELLLGLNELQKEYNDSVSAAHIEKMKQQIKEKVKVRKKEVNIKDKQEKVIKKLNQLLKTNDIEANDFYYELGWLASHTSRLYAAIPDYLENWFIRNFGSDAPKNVIDSRKKTSGGFAYQWAPGFSMHLKDTDNMPESLKLKLSDKKTIYNTAFVFDLVTNYGFKFGKNQDIDQILDQIPDSKVESFMKGMQI